MRLLLVAILLTTLLSGCVSDQVSFVRSMNGAFEPGAHDSVGHVDCGASTTLDVVSRVDGGSLNIEVHDGDGETVHAALQLAGDNENTQYKLSGEKGTWKLVLTRTDWTGSYNIQLRC